MIKIYYCNEVNGEFIHALADGALEDDVRACFKYEEEAVEYILNLSSGALLSIIIIDEYDGFEIFKPFEYVFYFLKENKDVLLKNIK